MSSAMGQLMPTLRECHDPLNPEYRFFVHRGTIMSGFNTAYMTYHVAAMAIEADHLYVNIDDMDGIRLATRVDLLSMETDEPGIYGGILYLDELEYVNKEDDPEYGVWPRCPHCGEAVRVALG